MPPSDALGDAAWPTQPFPVKPEPITRLSMTRAEVSKMPEAEKYCTEIYDQAVQMGPYTPYGMVPSISFPGLTGGGSNNGGSFDPGRGMVFATARHVATIGQLSAMLSSDVLPSFGKTKMPFEYYLDRDGYPCNAPPVGRAVRHQCQHRRHRLAGAARRIQGAGGEGHSEDRHRDQQRRAGRDRRRRRVHRRHGRRAVPGVRRDDRQGAVDGEPGFNVAGNAVVYKGANGKQYVVISGPRLIAYALP